MNNQNNNNNDIYSSYQENDNQNQSLNNQQTNTDQSYLVNNTNEKPKNQKFYKILMVVSLIAIIGGIGGFTLVYTGVIKFNHVAPESILLNVGSIGVKKGREFQYDYQVYPESSTAKNVYYESSNPEIAEVNSITGYVDPKKEGTVNITVKSSEDDHVIEKSVLTVTDSKVPATSLKLSSEKIVFDLSNKSKSQLLKVSLEPYDATNQDIVFSSSDEGVAIVDPSGKVFPIGFGMATITARTKEGNASAQCEVIVTDSENKKVYFDLPDKTKIVFPYSIQLDASYLRLKYGETRKVGFILLPPDVTEDVVTWISSDPSVATVNDGLVQGVAIGKTTITARTVNDLVATVTVDVTDEEVAATKVSFADDFYELEIGDMKSLAPRYDEMATVTNFSWSSDNPVVANVDNLGNVTALSAGEATITVRTQNGASASVKISVLKGEPLPTAISLEESEFNMEVGETRNVNAEGNTGNNNFIYQSSNEAVAKVNDRGEVTGTGVGDAIIYAKTVNGLSSELNAKVIAALANNVEIDTPNGTTVKVGDTLELVGEVFPANAIDKTLTWKSSDEKVLTVVNGSVKGVSVGKATVTAELSDGKNDTIEITVVAKSATIPENTPAPVKELTEEDKKFIQEELKFAYKKVNETKYSMSLNLDENGYDDYFDLKKTVVEIYQPTTTIKDLKIVKEKKQANGTYYITFKKGSYGEFKIRAVLTLKAGGTLEVIKDGPDLSANTKVSFDIEKDSSVSIYINFPETYQEVAKEVTEWISDNPEIASVEDGYIEANGVGKTTIHASQAGVNFVANVNVIENEAIRVKNWEQDYIYNTCYSLCSDGVISDTNIEKSDTCKSDTPYLIDKPNTEYHYTCTVGKVKNVYSGMSSDLPTLEDNLVFNYAPGSSVVKGQTITLKISNWKKLNLKSATVTTSLDNTPKEITKGEIKIDVPSSTKVDTFEIVVDSVNNKGRKYKDTLVLTVSSEQVIDTLECEELTLSAGQKGQLSCTMHDKTNDEKLPITEATYTSQNTKIAGVDKETGEVSAYKKGTTKIVVKAHGKQTKVNINVTSGTPIYNKLAVSFTKNNNSKVENEIEVGETGTLAYTLSVDGKKKAMDGYDVKYTTSNSNIISISGNTVTGTGAGEATITATYVNIKNKSITKNVKVKVTNKGELTPQITDVNCGSKDISVTNGDTYQLQCQMYDETYGTWSPVRGAKYSVPKQSFITIDATTGLITTKKIGSTTVTVKAQKKEVKIKVTVTSNKQTYTSLEASIAGNTSSYSLLISKGEDNKYIPTTAVIDYRLKTTDGNDTNSDPNVTITSSKPKVISVADNVITAKKPGTSKITIEYKNPGVKTPLTASITVKVVESMTCYRYREETEQFKACKTGYGFEKDNEKTCYKIVEAADKNACVKPSGQNITARKWLNNTCYDENDWYVNSKEKTLSEPKYTDKIKTANKYTFDETKDTLQNCRGECSADACNQ